jgi:uncharacterized LabA/DUF88 family protein
MVYVDGFNLYHGLHTNGRHAQLWLDLVKLGASLRPKQRLLCVRYFTAPVLNQPQAQARQAHYIDAMKSLHPTQISVTEGRYQAKPKTCLRCGHTYTHYEEKETDVNLATSIVVDASRKESDAALVISGDSDVAPAVRAARELNPDLFIAAAFPPNRTSQELRSLMPASFVIGQKKIRDAQLPDEFRAAGRTFHRPDKWC